MLQLRDYQQQTNEAVFDYWETEDGNPLIELATGTGKSLVMATLIERLLKGWPHMRVMVITHIAELIEQNYKELIGIWPFADAGIFSAGLGRRDHSSQIIFAGIQTVHRHAALIGHIDVMMVDECHLIPGNDNTMYKRFIVAMREINPDMKIVGLTATPYRLGTGRLDEGDDRLFDKVIYTYGIADGVRDGYLAPLSSKETVTGYDLAGVGRLGGDYKRDALEQAIDKDDVTQAAVQEVVTKGADRRSWLLFCAGVDHAFHIRDAVRAHGISCETVTGETPKDERRRILEDFKSFRLRAVTNNSVLTTGFNHKGVDLIAAMRPTLSVSLYVQMMGRGTRPLYALGMPTDTAAERVAAIKAGPKRNCLVLDFAGLIDKHGPVDMVKPKTPGKGDGEAPFKVCPECGEKLHASIMICTDCGHVFPPNEEEKITRHAADLPIMSKAEADWRQVKSRRFDYHEAKSAEKPPSVKVTYMVGYNGMSEWVCPEHRGYPKSKADRYWLTHGGARPFPTTVMQWLERQSELLSTDEISVAPNGRFWNVENYRVGTERVAADNDNERPAENDNRTSHWMEDDEIPF